MMKVLEPEAAEEKLRLLEEGDECGVLDGEMPGVELSVLDEALEDLRE